MVTLWFDSRAPVFWFPGVSKGVLVENIFDKWAEPAHVTIEGRKGKVVIVRDENVVTKDDQLFYVYWAVEGKYSGEMIYHLIFKCESDTTKSDQSFALSIIDQVRVEAIKKGIES
jgi:hypothetical protein